jgi:hypothetical protein
MTNGVPRVFCLRLPYLERQKALEIAMREGISLNHFISLSVAEKIARLEVLSFGPSARVHLPNSPVEIPRADPIPIVRNGSTVDEREATRDSLDANGRIVAEIDSEIARLRQARALLSHTAPHSKSVAVDRKHRKTE